MSNNTQPEIRFPGFMEDWEQRKLGELAESFEYGLNASAKNLMEVISIFVLLILMISVTSLIKVE